MDWRGNATLAGRLARAMARVSTDRALDWRDDGLPRTPAQVARAETLDRLLAAGPAAPLPRVASATLPGVDFESSNCRNFLVAVEWDAGRDAVTPPPATLYVKLPARELATRVFATAVGFWAVECAFARSAAAHVSIRVPRVLAVAERGSRFVLILENLSEEPGTRLFSNRDMAAGTDLDRARLCLEGLAELHAHFWNANAARREALLPSALDPYRAPGGRALTRALDAAAIGPTRRAAPDLFHRSHAALCRLAISKWDRVVDAWQAAPATLVHGDSHLANWFEYRHQDALRMGMLDFQGAHWCHGVRDVQYFLANSLDPELLAAHESELIDFYVEALARRGIPLAGNEARDRYRAYALQTLLVAVVSLGLGSLTERDSTLRTVLARNVAAVDRLDVGAWLSRL